MKLFFDARYIRTDFHDSMSRCSAELGNALAAITSVTFIISDKAQLSLLPPGCDYVMLRPPTSIFEPLAAFFLNKHHPDVVFSPMQTLGTMGRNYKVILMLHDLIYYHHRTPPRMFNLFIRIAWRLYHASYVPQRFVLNGADMVATVSETSKKAILSVNLTKRPIVVIPNAPRDLSMYLSSPVMVQKSPKNLVYMGTFMGYKNVETLIAGTEFLPGRILHLLSPITARRRAELEALIPKESTVIFHNGVSDEAYVKLLSDNAVLVSATRYEGFCLPVAEALALGIPAVISNLPVLHEVAGQGALYFNPDSPHEFAQQVLKLDDPNIINAVVKSGKDHIEQYDWKRSANVLLRAAKQLTTPDNPS